MPHVWVVTDHRYAMQRMPNAMVDWLRQHGTAVTVVLAEDTMHGIGPTADAHDAWAGLQSGDVVVGRTRNRHGVALLQAAARPGVRVLTEAHTITAIRDKPRATQILAEHGVPTPPTYLADHPLALRALDRRRFPLLLKPHTGDNARGIVLVRDAGELEDVDWRGAMVVAQQFVDAGGIDLKVYVAGTHVWAVRRPSPLVAGGSAAARVLEHVPVTGDLRTLALRCARAFELNLCGIDILESRYGPLVVDVNEFPNYTGVDDASEVIGGLVLQELRAEVSV